MMPFLFFNGTTRTLLLVMKEHILHGKYHTYIENGILKYQVHFFFFFNYKKTRNLKQKLNAELKNKIQKH